LKGRHGGWSIWLSVAFGMVWLLLLPGQSVARVPGSRDKQQTAEITPNVPKIILETDITEHPFIDRPTDKETEAWV